MSEDETYQLIENYLSGVLSKEEKSVFEKQLFTDVELSKQFRLHQLANELVIENRLQSVNNILLEEKNKGNSGNNLTKIIFSAVILVAGTVLFVTWKNKNTSTNTNPASIEAASSKANVPLVSESKTEEKNNLPQKKTETVPTSSSVQPENNKILISGASEKIISETRPEEKNKEIKEEVSVPAPVQEKNTSSPCAAVHLEAKVAATASCKDESNGAIYVREFTGGTAPYSVSIKNRQQEYVSSLNIPAGIYTIVIQDKKGCSNTITNFQIPEKLCEKEYTFNPFMEELLTLPTHEQYGTLSIYERSGNLYFSKETEPSETIQWNGYSKNGELNAGYFIFVLSLKDGQTIKGGITIVR
jgi:hypothetical protein